MRAFLWCCWHLGGSQSDVARLKAENIDWENRVVSFFRSKTGTAQIVHFGEGLAEVLWILPQSGLLFPRLAGMDEKHRASLFQRACRRVKVKGISLHSYRYAWAERARKAGYPERFAQEALGHTQAHAGAGAGWGSSSWSQTGGQALAKKGLSCGVLSLTGMLPDP